jgi:hypothetical protein
MAHSIQVSNKSAGGRAAGNVLVFLLGFGLAAGFYWAVDRYVPADGATGSLLIRYCCAHPIEYVEVWMFFWGLSALAAKWLHLMWQRSALRRAGKPDWAIAWDGKPAAVGDAQRLLKKLLALPWRLRHSLVGQRLLGGLDFVASRGSTDGLDEHLRNQADADADAMDVSHSLLRFITWAIPILGFLGTVLGITEAIANVSPDEMNTSIASVTSGLALAFDATALALAFALCLMFLTSLADRGEQGLLSAIDRIVEQQLAHRFERMGSEKNEFVGALKQNTQVLLQSTEKLIERQAELWRKSLSEMRSQQEKADEEQRGRFTAALSQMMEQTMEAHQQRLIQLERQAAEHSRRMAEHVEKQTRDTAQHFDTLGRAIQSLTAGLERQASRLAEQVNTLRQLLETEGQLAGLQETLNANLQGLVHAGTLDQAVHSLTAAIHLLTANAGGTPALPAHTVKFNPRQGNAA